MPFRDVLRRFGWANLHSFVTNAELEVKLLSEIGESGFNAIWNEYGVLTLDHALTYRLCVALSAECPCIG